MYVDTVRRQKIRPVWNSTKHPINKAYFLLLLILVPITATAVAESTLDVIYDDHVIYNLKNLIQKGNYSIVSGDVTYMFNTILDEEGWYTSNITSINSTDSSDSDTVRLKFKPNTDGTYSVVSTDVNIDTKVSSTGSVTGASSRLPDAPDTITKSVSDSGNDPKELKDSTTQNCPWWSDEWTVESSNSKYVGKVHIEWNGKDSFRYWCLFPYDIQSTKINYEGQERTNTSGKENFNIGSPPYLVQVDWKYSSAS